MHGRDVSRASRIVAERRSHHPHHSVYGGIAHDSVVPHRIEEVRLGYDIPGPIQQKAQEPFPHQTEGNVIVAFAHVNGEKRSYLDHVSWIALATAAFLPATCAPIGLTPEGLPVGMQIVGPYLGDRTTIRFAELLAEVRGGYRVLPNAL